MEQDQICRQSGENRCICQQQIGLGRSAIDSTTKGEERRSLTMRLFFFFQAEDGIRDLTVTGVQTCALPISSRVGYGALGMAKAEILRCTLLQISQTPWSGPPRPTQPTSRVSMMPWATHAR